MALIKGTVLRAGVPDANGDIYTEECLREMARKNPKMRFEGGVLKMEPIFDDVILLLNGGAIDLRQYECGDKCEHCGAEDGTFIIDHSLKMLVKIKLELCGATTMYHWNGTGENPNRPITFCQSCSEAHYDHWDKMWAEYCSSQGYA